MAGWTQSYVPSSTLRDQLKKVYSMNIGGTSPDTINIALYGSSFAGTIDTDPHPFSTTGEITGTNWATGGVALSGVTMTLVTSVGIMFDASDVSVASTTLSGVQGAVVYDTTITTPTSKPGLAAVYFGGTTYATSAGTFGITWDANGIWRITLH